MMKYFLIVLILVSCNKSNNSDKLHEFSREVVSSIKNVNFQYFRELSPNVKDIKSLIAKDTVLSENNMDIEGSQKIVFYDFLQYGINEFDIDFSDIKFKGVESIKEVGDRPIYEVVLKVSCKEQRHKIEIKCFENQGELKVLLLSWCKNDDCSFPYDPEIPQFLKK